MSCATCNWVRCRLGDLWFWLWIDGLHFWWEERRLYPHMEWRCPMPRRCGKCIASPYTKRIWSYNYRKYVASGQRDRDLAGIKHA